MSPGVGQPSKPHVPSQTSKTVTPSTAAPRSDSERHCRRIQLADGGSGFGRGRRPIFRSLESGFNTGNAILMLTAFAAAGFRLPARSVEPLPRPVTKRTANRERRSLSFAATLHVAPTSAPSRSMFRTFVIVAAVLTAAAACRGNPAVHGTAVITDTSAAQLAAPPVASTPTLAVRDTLPRVPILEYHLIGGRESRWSVQYDHFRAQLEMLYAHGYRPITV